jgi:PKD repeat protein
LRTESIIEKNGRTPKIHKGFVYLLYQNQHIRVLPKLSGPKTYIKTACLTAVCFLLMLVCNTETFGQLTASFTINKESGCKPLTVQFTNTTTGAGANVVYTWNFGNGNTSALTNPGATYIEEKTYTVTLTASSGGNTSTATKQITVYKTPTVDFSATPTKGCMPLEVGFTANATAGDGTISKYFWDFGDGETEEGPALTTPKHTYTFAQQAPVSLTVTNSFGCFNTKTYSGLVDVFQSVKADFEANKLAVCKSGESVKFTNKSAGGTLSKFEWDFGDGTTSTEKDPDHIYNKEGVFDVKLKVFNANGCTDEIVFEKYIRVGSFGEKINFNRQSIKCTGFDITTFYAAYDGDDFNFRVRWFLNDVPVNSYQEHLYDLHHTDTGKFRIRADFNFSGCEVSVVEEVIIYPKVELGGMVIKRPPSCELPFEITFSDTTKDAVKWTWTFWDATVPAEKRGLKEFTHIFPYESNITPTVFLGVENKYGCTAMDMKYFSLISTKVRVETTNTHYNDSFRCKERIYTFKGVVWNSLNDSFIIDSLEWDFGDTIIKGTNEPTYQFKSADDKNIIFRYKTVNGCSGTINYLMQQFIVVDSIDFSIQPGNKICGNNLFQLIPIGVPRDYESFYNDKWERLPLVRDARGNTIPYFQFRDSGTFDIHMIFNRMSQGYCIDTVTKSIQIKPPFSGIGQVIQTCDGDRGLVKIVDTSRFASSWEWDFGDGTKKTYTTKPDTVEHHYTTSGNYKVYQRVRFENCEVLDSIEVKIFLKQKPIITISGDSVCHHEYSHPLRITLADSSSNTTNLARNFYTYYEILHYPGGYSRGGFGFRYGNGSMVEMFPDSAGFTSLRVKIGDYYCSDTSDLIQFKVKGPSAHFGVQEHWKCFNDTIQFLDASQGNLNVPIVKWEWDFGDGTKISKNTGGNFGYRYSTPGDFFPYLKITDADGCNDETPGYLYAGGNLWLVGPKAVIGASATIVALNTTVNFSNNSFGRYPWEDGNYTWYMPDGSKVNDFEPAGYLFNKEGEYEVKLVSSNPYHDCIDSTTLKITVRAVNAQFTHSISYVNNNGCPPAIVRFTSTATNAVRYGWNFGNGATGGNATTVTHTYNQPGIYQVWHYSYDENNNVDSSFDFIEIKGPYAIISANKLSACNTLQVTLTADVRNADSFTWDLGDGTISSNPQTEITHQYLTAGIYTPSLILEDAAGCKATSVLPEKIIVDSLNGSFTYSPEKICAGANVVFTATPKSFSAEKLGKPISYEWKVADGNNTAPGQENTFDYIFNTQGTYAVTLTLESAYGCSKVISNTLNIQPPLNAAIQAASQICQRDSASFSASAYRHRGTIPLVYSRPTGNNYCYHQCTYLEHSGHLHHQPCGR